MLHGAEVNVYCKTNAKPINTAWQNVKLLNAKPFGASRNSVPDVVRWLRPRLSRFNPAKRAGT